MAKGSGHAGTLGSGMPQMYGPVENRVYVSNLPWDVTWQQLKEHMKSVGGVIYADLFTEGGRSKGCGLVSFKSREEAKRAVIELHDSDLGGRKIIVREDRVDQLEGQAKDCRVYIGNLSWDVTWKDLKDLCRTVGEVKRADVVEDSQGNSRGYGIVEFATAAEAQAAVETLTGQELRGRHVLNVQQAAVMALGATLAWLLAIGASGFGQQRWIIKNGYLKYKQSPQYCASLREGKVSNGVDIILWHCTKDAEHKFKVNGAYIQYEADPSYCVSVREGRAGDGSDIILWKCNDSPAFHWEVDGEFIKYKAKPSYVMSVRQDNPMDGADLILWRGAGMNDKWTFDGKLVRMDSDRSKCLSVSGKAGEGSNVVSASCGTGEPPVRWIREGKFIKWESNPRYCLSIRRGHIMDGEDVILWNCMDSPEFYWEVSGSYIQHAANQAYCLSVRETSGRKAVATAMIWSCQATEPLGLPVSADQRQQSMASENIWIVEGPYIKSSLDSKYCASVRKGEVTNGADIIMWHCMDSHEFKWTVKDGLIKSAAHPEYCMGVREGKAGDGADIILWSCENVDAFRWKVDGSSIVYKPDPRYFMTVRQGRLRDGANVILWSGYINPYLFSIEGNLIKSKADSSKCVSVREGKVGDGSDIILWSCAETDGFRWAVSHEHIVLDHGSNNHCLSVREGNAQDGADIILWTCGDGYADRWVVDGDRLRYKGNKNYCMSVREGRIGDGSDIILWACDEPYDLDDEL